MSPSSRIEAVARGSGLVSEALAVVREIHAGEFRATGAGEIPFVEHPMAVAERLAEEGFGETVLAAGLLHDALEYTSLELDELRARWGVDVAAIVYAMTEDMEIDVYEERKETLRELVAAAGPDARMVFAADRLANVEVLRRAYAIEGEDVDEDLPLELDRKILVWEYDLEMLFRESDGVPLVDRLASEMLALWRQRATDGNLAG